MLIYLLTTIISSVSFIFVAHADGKDLFGEPITSSLNGSAAKRLVYLTIGLLTVFVVLGFRYQIGVDHYDNYILAYNQLKAGITPQSGFGIAVRLIFNLLALADASPQWFFICTSMLLLIPLWYVIYKASPIPWLSCIIFIVARIMFIDMAYIGVGIAGALICLSFLFNKENRDGVSLLMIALAATFYWGAMLFLPVLWIGRKRIEPIHWIIGIGTISVFSGKLADVLTRFSSANMLFIDGIYPNRFDNTFFSMLFITGVACYYIDLNKELLSDDFFKVLFNTHMIGLLLSFNLNAIPYGIYIYWLYYTIEIIFVPYLISLIKSKKEALLVIIGIIVLFSYITYKDCAVAKILHCFPYRSFLYKTTLFT